MTEQQVWTSEPPTVDGEYRMRRDGVERVVKMVKTDGDWDAIGINMCWSWSVLSKHGAQRSVAPIPSAEELAAMREVVDAARDAFQHLLEEAPSGVTCSCNECALCGLLSVTAKVDAALSRLDATRAKRKD